MAKEKNRIRGNTHVTRLTKTRQGWLCLYLTTDTRWYSGKILTRRSLSQFVTSNLLTHHTTSLGYLSRPEPALVYRHSLGSAMSYMNWRGRFRQQGCPLPGTYLEFDYFLSDEEVDLVSVISRVIKTAPRLFPIPASTARFLVVASHGFGNIPMGNKSVEYKRIRYLWETWVLQRRDPVRRSAYSLGPGTGELTHKRTLEYIRVSWVRPLWPFKQAFLT